MHHHEKDVIFFRHGPGEHGPGPGGPWGGGPGDMFTMRLPGPPGFRGMRRGRRIRRGDVRAAILLLVEEQPRNGYQIMQELESRSGGVWRPSPGSVYPALQQLEDEGLIRSEEADGRRLYHLTEAGRAYVAERPDDQPAPWDTFNERPNDQHAQTGALMRDVGMAFFQVLQAGNEAQVAEAGRVLAETRRSLYRILADGEPGAEAPE